MCIVPLFYVCHHGRGDFNMRKHKKNASKPLTNDQKCEQTPLCAFCKRGYYVMPDLGWYCMLYHTFTDGCCIAKGEQTCAEYREMKQ